LPTPLLAEHSELAFSSPMEKELRGTPLIVRVGRVAMVLKPIDLRGIR